MTNIAQCPECQKQYKVPHLDKAWQCKVCRVPLILPEAQSPDPELDQSVQATCPECGASTAQMASSCKECGHTLGGDPYTPPVHTGRPARKKPELGSRRSIEESAARGAAKKELRKLGFLRFLIKLGLLTTFFSIIRDVYALTLSGDMVWPVVELIIDLLAAWFLWSTNVALSTIYGRPRPFVITLACLYTFMAIFGGELIFQIVGGMYAIMYWMFVRTLGRIQAIKDENPGAFADPGEVRSVAVDAKIHRRRVAEAKRASKERNRRLVVVGGVVGLLVIGLLGYKALNKPGEPVVIEIPSPDSVVLEFQSSWNLGDFSAVASLAEASRRDGWLGKLQKRNQRLGWEGHPPTLESGIVDSLSNTSLRVIYPSGSGSLGVRFSWVDNSWTLRSLDYRDLP